MSDLEKTVQGTAQDCSKEEVPKMAPELLEAVDASCLTEGLNKLAIEERMRMVEVLERMRQDLRDAFNISEPTDGNVEPEEAEQVPPAKGSETEKREDVRNRVVPPASEIRGLISEASKNEMKENFEDFPGAIEQMLYETFEGGEYKGKPLVDMFGFTEKEHQALEDWSSTKKVFLKAVSGDMDFVARTISKVGPNVYDTNQNNSTALMLACSSGNINIVDLLLTAGAKVNDTNLCERNALMEAAVGGFLEVVKLLVKHGADINKRDDKGDSALTFAHRGGHSEVAKFLESVITSKDSAQKESNNTAHCVDVPKTGDERSPKLLEHSSSKDSLLPSAAGEPVSLFSENSSGSSEQVVADISV